MKIIIENKRIDTIRIQIETAYELRALYLLLQLISRPEFRRVKHAVSDFDHIPGLGKYCKQDIRENPIKRLYQLMIGKELKKPTASELQAIILECKRAILEYNDRLIQLFNSDLMQLQSADKLPHSLMSKATSIGEPLQEKEFKLDNAYKLRSLLFKRSNDESRLYEQYLQFAEVLAGFATINTSYASNEGKLLKDFRILSQQILNDEYLHNNEVLVEGITNTWRRHISPPVVGSLAGLGVGTAIAVLKTYYDIALRPTVEGGSLILKVMVDNSEAILAAITVLYVNNHMSKYKQNKDGASKVDAVATLAEAFPEYKSLLIEKGYQFRANEITYINARGANDVAIDMGDDDEEQQASRSLLLGNN